MDAQTLHSIGSDIDSLTARLSKLSSRLQIYGVSVSNVSRQLASPRRKEYSHTQEDVIGIEQRISDVANRLVLGRGKVVLVYGMGGIGKSTLARSLYKDPSMKNHFDCFAWAYISQNLQLEAVLRDILIQLIPEHEVEERIKVNELPDSQVPSKLYDVQKSKKCLVILDDVWFSKDWKDLLPAFPLEDDTCGSKLLVTTRNRNIASNHAHDLVSYYETELLDEGKSWQLFEKKSDFIKSGKEDSLKYALASKMLNHCKGHPLAIVVLGRVLVTKKTDEEWQSVYNNLHSHLEGEELYSGVYDVLAMSYYELSYSLKACFLHLAYFPEDFEIPVRQVYSLWIAEGVVSSTEGKRSLEDMANDCLDELIQKGMVQLGHNDKNFEENIYSCRIHDLMRDVCLKMAKEENLLQIVDPKVGFVNSVFNHKLRRLGIYVGGNGDSIHKCLPDSSAGEVPPLRSILFFRIQAGTDQESCEWMSIVSKDYQLLRILDCSGLNFTGSMPNQVGKLIYLRYLSLFGTRVTELPYSIGNLRSLWVLDLRVSEVIVKVPNVLWKLKSLRQLYFPSRVLAQKSHAVDRGYEIQGGEVLCLDDLINLEKLEEVYLDTVNVNGLIRLTSMTELSANCVSKKESLELILKSSSIKSLSLRIRAHMLVDDPMMLSHCHNLKYLNISYRKGADFGLSITSEMFPQNLVELGFWYCKLQHDPMMVLAKLPQLKTLKLCLCYDELTLSCPPNAFPELVSLHIYSSCPSQKFKRGNNACPKLKLIVRRTLNNL